MPEQMIRMIALWVFGALAAPVQAATIETIPQNDMGCVLRISGTLEAGDAAQLETVLSGIDYRFSTTPEGERICLDSAGGSLVEGVKMGDLISRFDFGTVVEGGAVCESACAIMFMSGSFSHPEAEGNSVPDRLLHPKGRLGFHAPSLVAEDRSYSLQEINKAYAVALASMGQIVRLRSEGRSTMAESLFLTILTTPPGGMTYVETVGQAARWRIDVAPVALPKAASDRIILDACDNADAGLLDTEPRPWTQSGLSRAPKVTLTRASAQSARAFTQDGYRTEAVSSCHIQFSAPDSAVTRIGFLQMVGDSGNRDTRREVFPYLFYPASTRLQDLPVAQPRSNAGYAGFTASFDGAAGQAQAAVTFDSCFVQEERLMIVNVQNFVNLRQRPGFNAQVLRKVPKGERVTVLDAGRVHQVGSNAAKTRCRDICRSAARRPGNAAMKARANACIGDHVYWYRIRDGQGTSGFVSRKFLGARN